MIGRVISGRYEVQQVVGTGGMAVVYRAFDKKTRKIVALKVLRSQYTRDEEFVRRFDHEAEAASQMSHPNIVSIYGIGQDSDVRYIIMEFVEGRTLKDLIRQTGRIKTQKAVQMALRILAAVDHAHKNHIVHRDIKPQNILVDKQGNVKVADFGIARATNASQMTITDGGNVLGSVHYFSPEQASGKVADEKSDLYSVGVVIYEMLTGSVPFDGETPVSVAVKHVQEAPRSARLLEPEVSQALDEVIIKSLSKDPLKRYQTAADMANDLKRALRMPEGGFVNQAPAQTEEEREAERIARRRKIRFRFRLVGFMFILAAIAAGGVLIKNLYEDMVLKIKTPGVVLMNVEDAIRILAAEELQYQVYERYDNELELGTVIEQRPEVGELIMPGDTVDLAVSIGKERFEMPELSGMTRTEAEAKLYELGLELGGISLEVSHAHPGEVVGQSPAAGDLVQAGDEVVLRLSGESALMPKITGYTLNEAREILVAAGFRLGTVTERLSDVQEGIIIDQGIAEGQMALLDTSVTVTISQVKETTYRAEKDITVSVPSPGAVVECRIYEPSTGEREVYSALWEGGTANFTLNMDSYTPGDHRLIVLVDDEIVYEVDVFFE